MTLPVQSPPSFTKVAIVGMVLIFAREAGECVDVVPDRARSAILPIFGIPPIIHYALPFCWEA